MMKLTIRYNEKVRKSWRNLLIMFTMLAVIYVYINPNFWFNFLYIPLALAAALNYYINRKYQYITIDGDMLRRNEPFPKKINLSEVTRIKKFAGDYTLCTPDKELTISTEYIDKESLRDLEKVLCNLPVKIEEIPVNRWVDLKAAH